VDEEGIDKQFQRLESRVEELVRLCTELQNTKSELYQRIEGLESQLAAKDESERTYLEERSMIRSRMDSLLEKLDQAFQ
jgi:chromosome segregation ATPase